MGAAGARTAPAALAGLVLEGPIERRLSAPGAIALGLVAGSAALVAADRSPQARAAADAGLADAAWLGLAQAAALAPGVSRSGAVRSAARARGFTRAAAAELAAETALPVLAGATAFKGVRLAARRAGRARARGARGGRGRGGALHCRRAGGGAALRAAGVGVGGLPRRARGRRATATAQVR